MPVQEFKPLSNPPPLAGGEPSEQGGRDRGAQAAKKSKKRDVHGWIVLDKPVGMTSTHAVAVVTE